MRRLIILLLAACACALLTVRLGGATGGPDRDAVGGPAPADAVARPNILLITAEDLSPRLGSYGDPVARTPNLDRLAAEGVRFTQAYTTAGVCAPSRSSLITGVHQQALGTMHMRTRSFERPYQAVPPPEVKAFPELLRAAGYWTANDQKTDYQFGDPFTVWDASRGGADWTGRADGQPFFVMVNFNQTHESYTWPPGTRTTYPAQKTLERNARLDAAKTHRTDPAAVPVPPYYPDTPAVRANIARHYDNVAVMDEKVGRLLDRLKAEGLADETVVLFATDHGDGLPRAKRTVYASGLHVPLIVRWPDGRGAGTVRDDLVSFVDIAPTLLSLAGADVPSWTQGRVFLGADAAPPPQHVFAAADRLDEAPGRVKTARDARFAYVRNYAADAPVLPRLRYQDVNPIMAEMRAMHAAGTLPDAASALLEGPAPAEALYDLARDPHEVANVADDPRYAEELARKRAALDAWIARTGDLSALPEARLRERMWPGGEQPVTAAPSVCRTSGGDLRLVSATDGASIGWRGEGAWRLYGDPVAAANITAKAIRYGFAESEAVSLSVARAPACS